MTFTTVPLRVWPQKQVLRSPLRVPQTLLNLMEDGVVLALGLNVRQMDENLAQPQNGGLRVIAQKGDRQTTLHTRREIQSFLGKNTGMDLLEALHDALTSPDLFDTLCDAGRVRRRDVDNGPVHSTVWLLANGTLIVCDENPEHNALPETDIGGFLLNTQNHTNRIKPMAWPTNTHVDSLACVLLPPAFDLNSAHNRVEAHAWMKTTLTPQLRTTFDGVEHFPKLFQLMDQNLICLSLDPQDTQDTLS